MRLDDIKLQGGRVILFVPEHIPGQGDCMDRKIKVGVSACLLGERVRYDGTDKLDGFIKDTLGAYFEYVPVCPEAECGMGVPREPVRLTGDPAGPCMVGVSSGTDHTGGMKRWAAIRLRELEDEGLCGFIFKSRSPSCGVTDVEVFSADGAAVKTGTGMFARAFMDHFPQIPVVDEVRLHNLMQHDTLAEHEVMPVLWRELMSHGK